MSPFLGVTLACSKRANADRRATWCVSPASQAFKTGLANLKASGPVPSCMLNVLTNKQDFATSGQRSKRLRAERRKVLDQLCRQKPCNHPLLCPTSTHNFPLDVEKHQLWFTSAQAAKVWLEKQAKYQAGLDAMHEVKS